MSRYAQLFLVPEAMMEDSVDWLSFHIEHTKDKAVAEGYTPCGEAEASFPAKQFEFETLDPTPEGLKWLLISVPIAENEAVTPPQ